jgi:simple sugar transport system ATP-binding protein
MSTRGDMSIKGGLDASAMRSDGNGGTQLLEVRNIRRSFGHVEALCGVSFAVYPGEIIGLLGDNGAGKSTLIKILSGVVKPDSGEIFWEGESVQLASRAESAELGIETIFQDTALVDSMSVARNIFLGRELWAPLGFMRHSEMRRISADIVKTITGVEGIDSPDKPVGSLSGGQKQAVAIARAVYFNRRVLLLDEPTSALAVRATEALFTYLRTLRGSGISSVLVTHDLFDAHRVCDRLIVMARGEKILEATPAQTTIEELIERVSHG